MPCAVKRVQPVETGLLLPGAPGELDPAFGDPATGLIAEKRVQGADALAAPVLVCPEIPELLDQGIRPEHIPHPAALGDLGRILTRERGVPSGKNTSPTFRPTISASRRPVPRTRTRCHSPF